MARCGPGASPPRTGASGSRPPPGLLGRQRVRAPGRPLFAGAPCPHRGTGTRRHPPLRSPAPRAYLHVAAAPPGAAKATCPCPPWAALARAAADPQVMGRGQVGVGGRQERSQEQDQVVSGEKPGSRLGDQVWSPGWDRPPLSLGLLQPLATVAL